MTERSITVTGEQLNQTMEMAVDHHRCGRLQEAADGYSQILQQAPGFYAARHNLGMVRLGLNQPGVALELLERAYVEDGDNPAWAQSLPVIASTLYDSGYWEAAAPWLDRAGRLNPGNVPLSELLNRVSARRYLEPEIYDPGQNRVLKRYAPREAANYVYTIDIVGTCNLRCPTCPVGNSAEAERGKGFMPVELFRSIIAKILAEQVTDTPQIWLFNWGEPLLHPQLTEIISIVKEAGLPCHLSTNLNVEQGIKELAKANPANLKISLSGFTQETYGQTHQNGKLTLVKANLYLLRHYLDKYKATTQVWIGHHLYRNNLEQLDEVAALCRELNFAHHPLAAFYQPLERLVDLLEEKSPGVKPPILDLLLEHPNVYLKRIKASRGGDFDCELRFNQTVINFDGSVALCCGVYEADNMLGVNFLDQTHQQLLELKYRHPFCNSCFRHGLAYTPPVLPNA